MSYWLSHTRWSSSFNQTNFPQCLQVVLALIKVLLIAIICGFQMFLLFLTLISNISYLDNLTLPRGKNYNFNENDFSCRPYHPFPYEKSWVFIYDWRLVLNSSKIMTTIQACSINILAGCLDREAWLIANPHTIITSLTHGIPEPRPN